MLFFVIRLIIYCSLLKHTEVLSSTTYHMEFFEFGENSDLLKTRRVELG